MLKNEENEDVLWKIHWDADSGEGVKTHGDVCNAHVKITDDFSKGFVEWIGKNNYRMMGEMWTGWDFDGIKTTGELLTLYKNATSDAPK